MPKQRPEKTALLLLLVLLICFARAGRAAELPLNAEQMVQLSRQILVAVVEGQQARWNEQHTLIVTDYFLRVESRLRGKAADRVTLTMPGGTLDGETHDTSVSVHLREGERYLLFLRDLEQPQMSPITGSRQGTFREVLRANGTRGVEPAVGGEIKVAFADFVDAVRGLVRKTPSADPVIPGWSKTPNNLPAKVYSPLAAPPDGPIDLPQSLLLPGAVPPFPDDASQLMMKLQATGGARGPDTITDRYVYLRRPIPPVVFNPLPSSFTPWSPNDQGMMGYWNLYANNLFRVYQPSRGTWAWGDGIFDIAGFPSDAAMVSQFGNAWGPNILGVTYARAGGNGLLIEADIALNPHFAWTTDEADASTGASPANSFRQTMLHELGHAWGLQHPWETQRVWWDSVMNYAPKPFRLVRLYSDDVGAVRAAYPGTQIHDGLLSAYLTGFGSDNNPIYRASEPTSSVVAAGGSFQISQAITVENLGTNDLVNPKLEVYLTPQRISFDGAIHLTTFQYTGVVHPFPNNSIQSLPLNSLTVPPNTPSGLYAVAFYLRDDADGYTGNNGAWTNTFILVQGNSNLSCTPDATTLCVDDQSGDHRFKVTVNYQTQQGGGSSGSGKAIPLSPVGLHRGGLFWFFTADSPDMLVKVLNGCGVNGYYWVFISAGTNIGLTMTVTDTQNGRQKIYTNNDLNPAVPVQDTAAFSCSIR